MTTKTKILLLVAIIATLFISGCVDNTDSDSVATTNLVIDEFNTYSEQFVESNTAYDRALDKYNEDLNRYNDFISDYNDMSYSQQTSSISVNKKSTLKSETKSSARALIIQSEVMESQIDDLFIFMETNKEVIMNADSKTYLEIKRGLTETKATIKSNKAVVNEILLEI